MQQLIGLSLIGLGIYLGISILKNRKYKELESLSLVRRIGGSFAAILLGIVLLLDL